MNLSRLFNPNQAQSSSARDLEIQAWRERILRAILIVGIIGGLFALSTSIPIAIKQGNYFSAGSFLAIYLTVIIITIYTRIPYNVRAGIAILLAFALGLATLQFLGLMGSGRVWLFAFSVLATVLLGWTVGFITLFLNLITMLLFGWLMATGRIDWSVSEGHNVEVWTTTTVTFMLIIIMVTSFLGILVTGLENSLKKEKKMARELEKERTLLERRVQERTQDLDQKARELARSNNELQNFAHIASHDLQEPLRMISSYLQLLERRYKGQLDAEADEFIHYSVDGAQRMGALLDGLLSYARVDSKGSEFVPTSCETSVQAALDNLKIAIEENEAAVQVRDLPELMADPTQLAQLFQNLIGNTLKYRSEAPPEILISAAAEAENWHFTVVDNGIGFDPTQAERIFMIFQRLHTKDEAEGLGLGLAICKKIVERHGGRIWAESRAGGGATFHFTLPVAEGLGSGISQGVPVRSFKTTVEEIKSY